MNLTFMWILKSIKDYTDDNLHSGESELYSIMNNIAACGSLFPYANFYLQFIFPRGYQLRKYLFSLYFISMKTVCY